MPDAAATHTAAPLVQILPWDFRTSFPEPLEEAIEAGKLHEDDVEPENLKSLHEEHARQALALLSDLDAVMDARRKGVDPQTGKAPRTQKQRERLDTLFRDEPHQLEHGFDGLMDVYEEVFGAGATDAFRKAIRAWHAGVEVISETTPVIAPLPASINREAFGREEDGNTVHPSVEEVREITEQLADELTSLPDGPERQALLSKYTGDFGEAAARELDRWSRLKPNADEAQTHSYDPAHPWHYYHEGDCAEPLPLDQIPARPAGLKDFDVKWPKDPAKRKALIRQLFADQQAQLEEDEHRYQDLLERGAEALSRYDREIAHNGDDDLAWASAVAIKYTHIARGRGRVHYLRQELSGSSS